MKKLTSGILLLLLAYVSIANSYAWFRHSSSHSSSHSSYIGGSTYNVFNSAMNAGAKTLNKTYVQSNVSTKSSHSSYIGGSTYNLFKSAMNAGIYELKKTIPQSKNVITKSNDMVKMQDKANQPVSKDNNERKIVYKTIVNEIQSLPTESFQYLEPKIVNKLGTEESISKFKLSAKFDPNKVITFDDLKKLYNSNFTLYYGLLRCGHEDPAVSNLCDNIKNLLDDLTGNKKKLTINDVYKLQLYANTIAQAIFYEGSLMHFKKGAVVLGIDRTNDELKSLDMVTDYTSYDTENNDVLPVQAEEVDIDVLDTVPIGTKGDLKIVLGLNGGSVVGLRLYPVDNDLSIPYANTYKVMTIKGLTKGCKNKQYEYSIWYGYNNLGIGSSSKTLDPAGTKGIKFNFDEKCYDTFNN